MYPQSFRPVGLLAMAGLAILAGIIGWNILTPDRQQLRFSTGSTSGLYFEIASHIGELAEARIDGLDIEILASSGSLDNVQKLISAESDLAIVQNDTRGSSVVRSLAVRAQSFTP